MLRYGPSVIAQIVSSYELSGLNVYAIAEQLDIDDHKDVERILAGNSELYQKHIGANRLQSLDPGPKIGANLSVVNPEYEKLKQQYRSLAESAPESSVREKALRWLLDEERGRNDVALGHLELKSRELQTRSKQEERLEKFNELVKQMFRKGGPAPTVVDVESTSPLLEASNS